MKKFLLVILLTFSSLVHAQWILVTTSEIGTKTFIEMKSIQQINQYKRAWIKMEYSSNSQLAIKHNARSGRFYEEFDCREKKYRELTSTYFKQPDLIDELAAFNDTQPWNFVVPESIGEIKLNFVCKSK